MNRWIKKSVFLSMAIAGLILSQTTRAQDSSAADAGNGKLTVPNLSKEHEFDGIDVAKYANFWETWRLVSVRYRKDNVEQRFIYANDIAFKALQEGAKVFPKDAMFGKVAFRVKEDVAFPNSLEPKNITRIQLMKKDQRKYPESNGWGYAIYEAGKGVDYANAKSVVVSCHACHLLVPERDYVFSELAFGPRRGPHVDAAFASKFLDKVYDDLDSKLKDAIASTGVVPPPKAHVAVLEMSLFEGSISESIRPVIEFSRKNHKPYLLADKTNGYFIAASPSATDACPDQIKLSRIKSVFRKNDANKVSHRVLAHGFACKDTVTWEKNVRPVL